MAKNDKGETLEDLLAHLASRPGHDEVKSSFTQLLVSEFEVPRSSIDLERRLPEVSGRLDGLIGRTVLEAKSDLTKEWVDVERRMPDYLADREREEGERFIGIATDGLRWVALELEGGALVKLAERTLDSSRPQAFLAWLDGVVALKSSLATDAHTIKTELGQQSVAYRRASEKLRRLWNKLKDDPAVSLKRQLWAQLLRLVHGRDIEDDALWFQHTYLVVVAKAIAVAVLDVREDDPRRLLSGAVFEAANVYGAVESDFFDWIVADADGEDLVHRIVTHIRRFRLRDVQTDVLKVLYESLIDRDERHGLGEYYTPDWLAAKVVAHTVDRPMEQRVLDPGCGSGTFVFHAIRAYLAAADDAGMARDRLATEVTDHIFGMDIHPVAVIIARVTYLLALGPALSSRSGAISIPIYLGDALQLSISSLIGRKELTITVPPLPPKYGPATLSFPDVFCKDPNLFDKAIEVIRLGSDQDLKRSQVENQIKRIVEQHYKRSPTQEEQDGISDLGNTFVVYDQLRRVGRDSVWTYVARNLSRPLALSAGGGRANVLVGNPPWVAFRHMSKPMQAMFRAVALEEEVYVGGKMATQNDLCALFVARAAALYLRPGGRFGLVLPLAVMTRAQFAPLRSGEYKSAKIAYADAWTMDDGVAPLFPVPACVLFGKKQGKAKPTPQHVRAYAGRLPHRDATEAEADKALTVKSNVAAPTVALLTGGSVYRESFRQGATLVPRMLCIVERKASGRLGGDAKAPLVMSRRSAQEKKPYKDLAGLEHKIEREFLRPILLGESILPYRLYRAVEGIVPALEDGTVLSGKLAADYGYAGLHGWMKPAEKLWKEHSADEDRSLIERWNYHNGLSNQIPIAPLRVVYSKSGTLAAAMLLENSEAIIDHMLYWSAVETKREGHYLTAIMNSETARQAVANYQAVGQFGARHFDKVFFNLNIPRFDGSVALHTGLAKAAVRAEKVAVALSIDMTTGFRKARAQVRRALNDDGVGGEIEELVAELLGQA